MAVELYHGDCLDVMRTLEAESVDTIITDPPYGLEFMGKDWDHGIPGVAFWKEALRVSKPGAILLAFGGTRTHHRLMVAIEDAGWEIRDCLMWLYGSGFPKSHNISKAIDAHILRGGSNSRKLKQTNEMDRQFLKERKGKSRNNGILGEEAGNRPPITAPATPAAKLWNGYGTALKPAWEIVIAAQKPLTSEQKRCIIDENLLKMEAQLWSLLPANIAEKNFGLSQAEYDAVCDFAQWTADERRNTLDALCAQMDMYQFALVVSTCLHIVISWRSTLGESLSDGSTSTTKTETEKIIQLETLRLCVSALTPLSIIQAEIEAPGSRLSVLPAARYLNAAAESISATRMLSVLGDAIEQGRTSRPDDLGLEPNYSPIILAMKPLDGTFANNAIEHGVAGIWVDGGRIGTNGGGGNGLGSHFDRLGNTKPMVRHGENNTGTLGRFPANLILSHHPDCVEIGTRRVKGHRGYPNGPGGKSMHYSDQESRGADVRPNAWQGHADADGLETIPAYNCHPDCPVRLLDEQSGIQKSGVAVRRNGATGTWGTVGTFEVGKWTDKGFGDTGGASRFFYCAKASRRERTCGGEVENKHPTVKPLALMRYLVRLTRTPTGGTVLDMFAGSGTTPCACIPEGRDCIAIEKERASFEIMEARVKHAQSELQQLQLGV